MVDLDVSGARACPERDRARRLAPSHRSRCSRSSACDRRRCPTSATFVLVADRIADPGNAGTIIRSAEAAGADAVVFTPGSVDLYNPKVVRASAGSLFRMPVVAARRSSCAVGGFVDWEPRRIVGIAYTGPDLRTAGRGGRRQRGARRRRRRPGRRVDHDPPRRRRPRASTWRWRRRCWHLKSLGSGARSRMKRWSIGDFGAPGRCSGLRADTLTSRRLNARGVLAQCRVMR